MSLKSVLGVVRRALSPARTPRADEADRLDIGSSPAISVPPLHLWQRPAPLATGIMTLLGVTMLALSGSPLRPGTSDAVPPVNPRPVIVLMDSPLPDRVYDPRTLAAGGTNADDVSDALRNLEVATCKENTSAMWHREEPRFPRLKGRLLEILPVGRDHVSHSTGCRERGPSDLRGSYG